MAGRIPQNFIDDLLARVNIVDLIDGRVKLKKSGKNYSGLCPFHQEKSPSFSVSPDKQFYYCFGCGAGGNAIGFLMEYDRLEFPQAVEEVAKLVGVDVPRDEHQEQQRNEYKAQYNILDEAAIFYQDQLKTHAHRDQAVAYLKSRGLTGQIAKIFGVGYAPPGWDNLLKKIGGTPTNLELLEKSGMLIRHEEKDSLYDRFRERIIFPIRDMRGRVIAFGGRVLGDDKPKYLNSPETDTFHKSRELYGLYEARKLSQKLERIIIVEGYMDVISLAQFGITYAVATLGTATTTQHLERLFKTVPEIIFCFDGDNAGRKAAERALETTLPVIKDGQEARFLFLPEGEDPDTLVRSESKQGFEKHLDEALPLSEFFFRSLAEDTDMTTMDGQARFSNKALPLIHQMQTSLLQQMMLDRICKVTGLSLEQINSTINLTQSTPEPTARPPKDTKAHSFTPTKKRSITSQKQQTASLCSHIISLLLHYPKLATKVYDSKQLADLNEPHIDLLCLLIDYLKNTNTTSLGPLLIDWRDDSNLNNHLLQLSEISHLDPVLNGDPNLLFDEAWARLLSRQQEHELEELQKKPLSSLTPNEKERLRSLTSIK
ncbi:DNA primase [Neptunomonas japonica]|uniref:DNA primase n=1 Tax=Neptunomonas japonica JAMM 1380 TaxID=1441457 RepID=A0A7R6SUP0_9GAMM|nr:DNA primase [Neptunomonas japonica]BBB28724.1 DNA primase [Neptunomonas japonica JAMM 1380]